ncbi:CBS domain-containing protein [Mangrovicoccus sp. HB161399]|uniref:CBS domain-containing protein n=1 Tax=Mangrovicoccus sp. HB161399 TaxID=2720392 RepID=UPI001556E5D0|nr:CBS domain-containing protein [Mangrovicoccus sp. HB161399]
MIHQSIAMIVTSRPLQTVSPDATVREACHKLAVAPEGAVAVLDGRELVGIVSEHDVIARAICADRATTETLVAAVMTADPCTIDVSASLAEAMKIMTDGDFRHLPVMLGSELVGILSMRDIPTQYRLLVERFAEFRDTALGPDDRVTMLV